MAFYPDGTFAMGHPAHHSMYFPRAQYPAYMHQQPHPEMMYQNYPFQDFPDFLQPGMMHEDFDDPSEVSTRPRLTKDQVEVLEAQFLSHPKPNSMVKKQLAMQTKLTLPRVAVSHQCSSSVSYTDVSYRIGFRIAEPRQSNSGSRKNMRFSKISA